MAEVDDNLRDLNDSSYHTKASPQTLIILCRYSQNIFMIRILTSYKCLLDDSVYKYYENHGFSFLIIQRAIL